MRRPEAATPPGRREAQAVAANRARARRLADNYELPDGALTLARAGWARIGRALLLDVRVHDIHRARWKPLLVGLFRILKLRRVARGVLENTRVFVRHLEGLEPEEEPLTADSNLMRYPNHLPSAPPAYHVFPEYASVETQTEEEWAESYRGRPRLTSAACGCLRFGGRVFATLVRNTAWRTQVFPLLWRTLQIHFPGLSVTSIGALAFLLQSVVPTHAWLWIFEKI